MSEVTKPIALDESFNTTGQTPKNIADVIKNGLQEVAQAIDSHQGGGGHVILDQNGNALDQEPNMQFVDAHTSDDSVNTKTIIENIKSVTEADFRTATEDGLYDVDVEGAEFGEISEDYVEVTADGNTTWSNLLNSLYALIDSTKLNNNTKLSFGGIIYNPILLQGVDYYFSRSGVENSLPAIFEVGVLSSSSYYRFYQNNTYTDRSSTAPSSGTKITLYYGNDKAVVDLQTTANRCWYDSSHTVKDILKKTISSRDYQTDYAYNVWTTHTKIFTELTTIENAFISIIGGWTTSTPHEAMIVVISGNTVTYACKGMWSGGASGIDVMITAIGV